jgi:hypothetical protein
MNEPNLLRLQRQMPCRKIEIGMMNRRIFAGSVVALLLSASSLAAACDLSCAFLSMNSDCHAEQTESQDSAPDGMKMDGMAMAGMTMPEMASGGERQAVSANSQARASHPSIGEMGPCEKQACDNGSAISATTARSGNSHFHSILAASETPRDLGALKLFHDARDDVATHHVRDASPLQLSLRV